MSELISDNIISQVKKELGIEGDLSNTELFKKLLNAIKNCHPDKFPNGDAKKMATEKTTKLIQLRKDLKQYIEQTTVCSQLATLDDNNPLDIIEQISKETDTELEILGLKKEIKDLQSTIESAKRKNQSLKKKYESFVVLTTENKKEQLTDIYKPKKLNNVLGLGAALTTMVVFVPQVKSLISELGLSGDIALFILLSITTLWILALLRNTLTNSIITSLIDQVLVGEDLMNALEVKIPEKPYSSASFTEKNLSDFVDSKMKSRLFKILLYGKYGTVRRQIVEYIILELERKGIITDSRAYNMQRIFYLGYSNFSGDDFEF